MTDIKCTSPPLKIHRGKAIEQTYDAAHPLRDSGQTTNFPVDFVEIVLCESIINSISIFSIHIFFLFSKSVLKYLTSIQI